MNREECSERIRLVDEYSRLITEFNNLLESLNNPAHERKERVWRAAAGARADSQIAWESLEKHIAQHKCIDNSQQDPDAYSAVGSDGVLEKAAMAAIDIILVADDDRQFVEVNEAAADAFGLSRSEIIGRRIDEFFATAGGKRIPAAWNDFIAAGAQSGICEMNAPGRRKFEYQARANFAPGLHLSVLRSVKGSGSPSSSLVGSLIEELAHEMPDEPYLETVRTDLLAASRSDYSEQKDLVLRLYLAVRSLLREHSFLKERLRRADSSKVNQAREFGNEGIEG